MFSTDLKKGLEAEVLYAEHLLSQGFKVIRTHGLNKDWDIGVYENNIILNTFEIKRDIISDRSGNLAIEVAFKGSKSGITATKADYLVIYAKGKVYELKTQEFKEWLILNKPYLKYVRGGDNNESIMALIKPSDIVNHSWCIINEI